MTFQELLPETIFDAAETLGGRCTGRFLALNAMENRVYDIQMESGEHVVIKFYRPGRWTADQIQAEHDFLRELEVDEVPVVRPKADESGRTLFEKDGIYFTIFPKKQGRLEPELSQEQTIRLGRFLARIHNVGARLRGQARPQLNPQTFGRDSLQYLKDSGVVPDNILPRFELLINQICTAVEPLFQHYEPILLHGDCHCGNLLWQGEAPFFIDFDDMLYAPPVQDIWMLTGADDDDGKRRKEWLMEAYEEIRPFDHSSLKLVEPLRTLRMIYFNAWIARRWEDGAFKKTFPGFGSERYWQEQIEGLSVRLEKVSD